MKYFPDPVAGIFGLDQEGKPVASVSSFMAGLDWLLGQGIRTINTSLSGPENDLMALAVDAALRQHARLVAAVGNDGLSDTPRYPAAYPGVIGVTAVDATRHPFAQANRGNFVTLAAPGVDLWVPVADAKATTNGIFVSGTSFATPFVVATLAAANNDAALLTANAIDLGEAGVDPVFGHGLVQAANVCPATTP